MDELGFILEKSDKAANQYESKIKTVKGFMHEDYTVAKLKEDGTKLGIDGIVYEMISGINPFKVKNKNKFEKLQMITQAKIPYFPIFSENAKSLL